MREHGQVNPTRAIQEYRQRMARDMEFDELVALVHALERRIADLERGKDDGK